MKTIIFTLIIFSSTILQAQYSLKGKVVNKQKQAIIGAVIYIPKLHKGTMTDGNGKFYISNIHLKNYEVSISLIGYQTKIVSINSTNENKELTVKLEEQLFETQEVIVSGNKFSLQHENAIKSSV